VLEDDTDLFEDDPVLPVSQTHQSLAPRVVAAARHAEQPTEPRHTEPLALVVDEREDVGFRAEVNRMTFFKRACSSASRACARALERLKAPHLPGGRGLLDRLRHRHPSAQHAIPRFLSPPGQHEGMDLERLGDGLHFNTLQPTELHRLEFEL
jgi:hypothetical protein